MIELALKRPTLNTPGLRLQRVTYGLLADRPVEAFATLRASIANTPPAEFRRVPANERITAMAMALNTAAAVGNAGELQRLLDFVAAADPVFPFTTTPTKDVLAWYLAGLRAGITGTVSREDRALLAGGTRRVLAGGEGIAAQLASTSGGVVFAAYLATRDTLFSNALRRMPGMAQAQHTDLDALEALSRGDTAAARAIAQRYTHPDSLATARFSFAGARAVARAEVLAAVGNDDWAIRYLEALDPSRFNAQALSEPGFAIYTRSFLSRAALYERTNQRDKAIAAYEEYLRRTADGDGMVEPLRRSARDAVARLRDRGR